MNPSTNLVLIGPMGAGKSSLGPVLARHYGLRLVDIDAAIERDAGIRIEQIFQGEGEEGFRARERAMLAQTLASDDLVVVTGGGAVLDSDNRQQLHRRGFVVHLHVGVERQIERLGDDRSRPLLARSQEGLLAMARWRTPLYMQIADLSLDTDGHDQNEMAARLLRELDTHWQRGESPALLWSAKP